jgi:hypothetical protein
VKILLNLLFNYSEKLTLDKMLANIYPLYLRRAALIRPSGTFSQREKGNKIRIELPDLHC